jgi:cysteinyl-tRNA synthetase
VTVREGTPKYLIENRSTRLSMYVKSIFVVHVVHVGGTRCVTSSTDNIMKILARITLTVEFIRGYIFIFLLYV